MRAGACLFLLLTSTLSASPCEQLTGLELPAAKVVSAETVRAGTFLPPGVAAHTPAAATYKKLPAFCRAVLKATPSSDSRIPIEVWMPTTGWNHKYRGQGNGGFAGAIDYHGMAGSISLGYATSATDTGHKGEATDAGWALHHPEKIVDFGYRAIHLTAVLAKAVIEAFYHTAASRSYFDSCSDGGREALMEAERFPEDYDGILAGAPANDWTHLLGAALDLAKSTTASRANFIPPAKLPVVTRAALETCDAQDGVRDGIVNDPRRCHFDPTTLLCGTIGQACFSNSQIQTLQKIYAGGSDSQGSQIFPGAMPTGEDGEGGWKDWLTGPEFGKASMVAYSTSFFQNMVFEDPQWNYHTANVSAALRVADQKLAPVLNATDPDLQGMKTRGHKLILYHGWLDPAISPLGSVRYYRRVVSKMGQQSADEFLRLYMVPGMRHCVGGPGPYMFGQLGVSVSRDPAQNIFVALEKWVEKDIAPQSIIATKLNDDHDSSKGVLMTRPLCPFPETAVYDGKSDPKKAAAFVCAKYQN
jgi:Tannase and feruloyl esterase